MSTGPATRQSPYDIFADLTENITRTPTEPVHALRFLECPQLIVRVADVPVSALLDTGSQITCVSEKYYAYIRTHIRVVELPVANMVVTTAVGKKPTKVKRQVVLEISFGTLTVSCPFLIIPCLTSNMIIGNDWMHQNKAVLDYDRMSLTVKGYIVPPELILFDRARSERVISTQQDDIVYVQIVRSADVLQGLEFLQKCARDAKHSHCVPSELGGSLTFSAKQIVDRCSSSRSELETLGDKNYNRFAVILLELAMPRE